jgi:hypothetical protein
LAAADRARWLGELTEVLEEAQQLIWRLGVAELLEVDALDLLARLESARAEARSLRLGRLSDPISSPEWSDPIPWDEPQPERCT